MAAFPLTFPENPQMPRPFSRDDRSSGGMEADGHALRSRQPAFPFFRVEAPDPPDPPNRPFFPGAPSLHKRPAGSVPAGHPVRPLSRQRRLFSAFPEKPLSRERPAARRKRFHDTGKPAFPAMPPRLFRLSPADKALYCPSRPFPFSLPEVRRFCLFRRQPARPETGASRPETGMALRIRSGFRLSGLRWQAPPACCPAVLLSCRPLPDRLSPATRPAGPALFRPIAP